MAINVIPVKPANSQWARLFACVFRQAAKLKTCPAIEDFSGKNVLITGGSSGVGEFISSALLDAGAQVISLSRGVSKAKNNLDNIYAITCDLAKPEAIVAAVEQLNGIKIDLLICNSGVVLNKYHTTPNGLEKTFAVNVFGHHLLYRLLIEKAMLANNGRIIITTGEAYLSATNCLPDRNIYKGFEAYGASKLGNLWQVLALKQHYPKLKTIAIHPGVVASGFGGGSKSGVSHWLKSKLLISEQQGAQAALIAATQNLPNGAYWHNTQGLMKLAEHDIANDADKSAELWQQLETLASPWL